MILTMHIRNSLREHPWPSESKIRPGLHVQKYLPGVLTHISVQLPF